MEIPNVPEERNPLAGLVSDEVYKALVDHNVLDHKGVRDYQLRRAYRALRRKDTPAGEAIEMLREQYPYLQFDTIRKIVYGLRRTRSRA